MRHFFTLILILFSFAFTTAPCDSDLVVRLKTDAELSSLEVSPIKSQGGAFSEDYLQRLEGILAFDFDHNGATVVKKGTKGGVSYRLMSLLKKDHLLVRLENLETGEQIELEPMKLTGDLSHDRQVVHKIADILCEEGFGIRGIATSRLLYTHRYDDHGTERSDVWESDYDGANARQLTHNGGYCVTPTYIPTTHGQAPTHFLYVSYKTGQPKIYMASLKDGYGGHVLRLSGNQLMPTISRQRDGIAFISDTTGNPDLFFQRFDPNEGCVGKPRHLFTAPLATQGTPTFSPDGQRIAFVSNKAGSPRIYLMEIPTPGTSLREINLTLLTKFNRENTAPCWSPDGTKIAYCAKTDGVRQIWVYDFLTGLERQLTKGAGNKENPSWARNSLHIMYNTTDAKSCELYLVDTKTLRPTKVTSGSGDKRFPAFVRS